MQVFISCYTYVLHDTMAFCSIRMTDRDKAILEEYARAVNKSISEVLRESFFEKLEDELDIKTADEAYSIFLGNPKTRTLDEVMNDYGL